ncbi:MAG: DNA methyltransferase [Candidatus Methanoperedens sp.]
MCEAGVTVENRILKLDPADWSGSSMGTESTLHQLAPYIGKLKSNLVRELIQSYTKPKDTIFDPFAGAGTVALESLTLGRNAIANDINPYAVTLTKAKMFPPNSLDDTIEKAHYYLKRSKKEINTCSLSEIPDWVRSFFHPTTLKEIVVLSRLLKENEEYFLLACLLGILHHQRIGFLSYPSSHLVPYLRTKKFPKEDFAELYTYREVSPRLINKIKRAFRRFPNYDPTLSKKCLQEDATTLRLPDNSIDAVITSPPYMNALDYGRDNRLRLWFLDEEDYTYYDKKNPSSVEDFKILIERTLNNLKYALNQGSYCIFILGEVHKSNNSINTGLIFKDIALNKMNDFKMVSIIEDKIPDIRRTRKNGNKTKKEWIIVLQRED